MSKLAWYWHRLRAMSPGEMALHVRKKWRQAADAKRSSWPEVDLICSGAFPKLPKPEDAPEVLREALKRDVENILAGRWKFFGHLELQVDDPPKWQYDYLVRREMKSNESAFKLNYRSLPEGVDSKLIWEPSRWYQLVRLAMAAYVLSDRRAGEKCAEWLEDWVKHNPPYRGWNWTSALEVGMRLIQFAWMDALLGNLRFTIYDLRGGDSLGDRLSKLRRAILPAHVWYAWRHKSFGSSANNHLLGELVGCIVATARWPGLVKCGVSLDELQIRWEHEVLAQFAEDGGNKEQALNYHLFSWEFCWQARMALVAADRKSSPEVDERLRRAAQFFVDVQVPTDPWDYGDSDNAVVTPFAADESQAVAERHRWFSEAGGSAAIEYWLGGAMEDCQSPIANRQGEIEETSLAKLKGGWRYCERSGYAVRCEGDWTFRWDLSPLGLGSMAAHGHLDALHVSIWLRGVAMVIDPGTGAYHANNRLRNWLTSRSAHNSPTSEGTEWPQRLGPFLWAETHELALVDGGLVAAPSADHKAELVTKTLSLGRRIERPAVEFSFTVEDWIESLRDDWADAARAFSVRWQFAPESCVEVLAERRFRVTRRGVSMEVQVSVDWAEAFCVTEQSQVAKADPDAPLAGLVSPAFCKTVWAPYLKLVARPQGDKPCVFRTTFIASAR